MELFSTVCWQMVLFRQATKIKITYCLVNMDSSGFHQIHENRFTLNLHQIVSKFKPTDCNQFGQKRFFDRF